MSVAREWQAAWHGILDAELGPDPEAGDDLPELDCDFRLQFETWDLPEAALARCFGLLPQGAELAARAIEMHAALRDEARKVMTEAEALACLQKGLAALAPHVETDFGPGTPIRVLRGDGKALIEAFQRADPPTIDLNDRLSTLARAHSGALGEAAYFFSGEILYRLASDYAVANFIAWPLCHDPAASDPYRAFARLALQRVHPGLDCEGVFLFLPE